MHGTHQRLANAVFICMVACFSLAACTQESAEDVVSAEWRQQEEASLAERIRRDLYMGLEHTPRQVEEWRQFFIGVEDGRIHVGLSVEDFLQLVTPYKSYVDKDVTVIVISQPSWLGETKVTARNGKLVCGYTISRVGSSPCYFGGYPHTDTSGHSDLFEHEFGLCPAEGFRDIYEAPLWDSSGRLHWPQ